MQGQVSNPVMAEPLDGWRWTSFSKTTSKDIRIATYNVLADAYASTKQAKNGMFYYCADEVLSAGPRRQKILRDLLKLDADILGLQEVDTTQLTVLKPLKELGWEHTYIRWLDQKVAVLSCRLTYRSFVVSWFCLPDNYYTQMQDVVLLNFSCDASAGVNVMLQKAGQLETFSENLKYRTL